MRASSLSRHGLQVGAAAIALLGLECARAADALVAVGTADVAATVPRIELKQACDRIGITLDGQPFTELRVGKDLKHGPVLFPLVGPGGVPLTRSWPVGPLLPGEPQDHPHHESFWCTHGDVNGHDFWTGRDGSRIEVASVDHVGDGRIEVSCRWLDSEGTVVCTDRRTLTFSAEDDDRIIDHIITITASHGPLVLGDTKDGTMAVRVRPELNTTQAAGGPPATGHYLNANGDRDGEAWGKPAAWVDLSGMIDGQPVGIACFDHPHNLRHPSTWHARDYGLFAANPFGLHDFTGAPRGEGSVSLQSGESLTLQHRWMLHTGDAALARVADRYAIWAESER